MKTYLAILKKYRLSFIVSPLLVLIAVLSETIQPYYMSKIVDEGIIDGDLDMIYHTGFLMVLIAIAGLAVSIANVFVSTRTSISFGTDLRATLFKKIEELSFTDIDRFSTASLITRLTNDISRIQQVILMSLRVMLRAPLMLVMSIFFVVKINPRLAVILLFAIPLLALCTYFILRRGFPFFLIVQQKIDALNGVVRENLINIRVVKSFVREDYETEKFTRSSTDLKEIVVKSTNIIITLMPVMQLILNFSILAVLWFGGLQVSSGTLQPGELIAFVNYLMQVLMSLMMLSNVIMNFARASASSRRIAEVLNAEPSLTNTVEGLTANHRIARGEIEFQDVYFRYEDGETDVLQDINFRVGAGQTVAIAGATGSSKTSLVQLIPRLYDVTGGTIRIDGTDVRDYELDYLHRRVGVVLQKNELFTGTIIDNLRWGDPDATFEEIVLAAKAAQAHDFIESFTDGYQTMLGRGGVNISGGQKQRLCIARALLRRPQILILDDSTSAVDTETELKIRRNLSNMKGTTVLIITQRIHTMQSADRVLILEDGRIEAYGTPDELLETSDMYREIYNSQQIEL
ncbi:MAG: ABC transporter ATP-binding protein/permease [Rikenellaceae bacterium]|nr:ABC transporter ATP-binding protein/permease [Rikenellaceae bacterium]